MNIKTPIPTPTSFFKASRWLLFLGIVMIILGALAVIFSFTATMATIVAIGTLILIAGVVLIGDSLKYWPHWGSFLLHLFIGIIYLFVGIMLINNPLIASVSFTLLLGVFYVIIGVVRLVNATYYYRSWNFISGLLAILIGVLILMSWPSSALWVIGLFVGIDLLVYGWALVMLAMTGKRVLRS